MITLESDGSAYTAEVIHKDVKPQAVLAVEKRRVSLPNTLLSRGIVQVWKHGCSMLAPALEDVGNTRRIGE